MDLLVSLQARPAVWGGFAHKGTFQSLLVSECTFGTGRVNGRVSALTDKGTFQNLLVSEFTLGSQKLILGWSGEALGSQDGSRWNQDGPTWGQDGAKMSHDGAKLSQDGSRWRGGGGDKTKKTYI